MTIAHGNTDHVFLDRDVAVIPFPTLGDTTIYLRLAQTLANAGARVSFYSDLLAPAADLLPWLTVTPIAQRDIGTLLGEHELVIADILARPVSPLADDNRGRQRARQSAGRDDQKPAAGLRPAACRHACRLAGRFGDAAAYPAAPDDAESEQRLSAQVLCEIRSGAHGTRLAPRGGVHVARTRDMRQALPTAMARIFPNLREPMLHLRQSRAGVSNDSGGGCLGSMLSLRAFTITKKSPNLIWRPEITQGNRFIGPTMTFKWLSARIWRPFIPLCSSVSALGAAPSNPQR